MPMALNLKDSSRVRTCPFADKDIRMISRA